MAARDTARGLPPSSVAHPRRILVRGVNWLGDAVMTTPALQRLREAQPQAEITLLTHEKLKDLWLHHPDIDDVMTFTAGEGAFSVAKRLRDATVLDGLMWGVQAFEEATLAVASKKEVPDTVAKALAAWGKEVPATVAEALARARERAFDVALVLPNSPRSALEAWLARIPQRIGYARPGRNWFLTQAVPPRPEHVKMRKRSRREIGKLVAAAPAGLPITNRQSPIASPHAHQIHEYLHLVAALGANPEPVPPFLHVTEEEVEAARWQFALEADRRWLGLVPGAEYGPAKRWPKESFIAAARELQQRTNCGLVLFGGPADAPLAAEIESALHTPHAASRNLTGQTTLRQLCAGLKVCAVVVTNDSGPMHVAAAVGTPVVVPFGSTAPGLTGPGLPGAGRHRLLTSDAPCAPCFRRECPIDFRCMKGIGPLRVIEAVLEILRPPA